MSLPNCLAAVVLLIDVSGSIDNSHYAAQRDGTAAAFEHPQVITAIESSGGIAATVVEFAYRSTTQLSWTIIRDEMSARQFATDIRALGRSDNGFITAIGDAIEHGRALLRSAPCLAERRVVDVSTDGYAEGGRIGPVQARDAAVADGIEINALLFDATVDPDAEPYDMDEIHAAEDWLRRNVATGFVRLTHRTGTYGDAFRHKLVLEIAGHPR
ncbi:DUF1194 domain-containing protein [Falsiroseomonas oryzae]|uniref:DUF1194 domain-containing protein n=1 Tax=Falsiroseomonas oryzae TaxID=2766473 RepID=UPI0022EA3E26|nr:DUF1194 domain-containing protein [Roseomonas sp. MO-31]